MVLTPPKCQFDAVIMTGHWSSATGPKRAQSYSVNKENNGGGSLANSISEFGFNTGLMGNCEACIKFECLHIFSGHRPSFAIGPRKCISDRKGVSNRATASSFICQNVPYMGCTKYICGWARIEMKFWGGGQSKEAERWLTLYHIRVQEVINLSREDCQSKWAEPNNSWKATGANVARAIFSIVFHDRTRRA